MNYKIFCFEIVKSTCRVTKLRYITSNWYVEQKSGMLTRNVNEVLHCDQSTSTGLCTTSMTTKTTVYEE